MAAGLPNAGTATTFAGASTSAVPYPAVTHVGQYLTMGIALFGAGTSCTTPAGWTLLGTQGGTGNTTIPTLYVFAKYADGTEGGTTVTVTHGLVANECIIAEIGSIDSSVALDVAVVLTDQSAGGTANLALNTIQPVTDRALLIYWASSNTAIQTATPPANWTEFADGSGASVNLEAAYLPNATTSVATGGTVVFSGAGKQVAVLVALRPASVDLPIQQKLRPVQRRRYRPIRTFQVPPPPVSAFSQTLAIVEAPIRALRADVAAKLGPVVEAPVRNLRASVAFILAVSTPSPSDELSVASQDFEDGTIGAWGTAGVSPPTLTNSTVQAHTGTHSLASTMPSAAGGFGGPTQTVITYNCPTIGAAVTVDFWVFVPSGGMPTVRGTINGIGAFTAFSTTNDAWEHLYVTFIATSATHTLSVYPTGATTAGQVFYLDTAHVRPSLVRRQLAAVAASLPVVETTLRSARAAAAATVARIENPVEVLRAAVTQRLGPVVEAPVPSQVATVVKLLAVSVVETTVPKLRAAVAATLTRTEAPARVLAAAVAARLAGTEAPVRTLRAAVAATLTRTEQPTPTIRAASSASVRAGVTDSPTLRAAVTASLRATVTDLAILRAAVAARLGPVVEVGVARLTTTVGVVSRATEAPARTIRAAVTATNRATEAGTARLLAAVSQVLRRVEAPVASSQNVTTATLNVKATATMVGRLLAAVGARFSVIENPVETVRRAIAASLRAQVMATRNRIVKASYFATSLAGVSFQHGTYVLGAGTKTPTAFLGTADGTLDGLRLNFPGSLPTMPASPGEQYAGGAYVTNTSGTTQVVSIYVEFFDATQAYLVSQHLGTATLLAGVGAAIYSNLQVPGIAPPTTAYAHLLILSSNTPNGYTQTVELPTLYRTFDGITENVTATRAIVETVTRRAISGVGLVFRVGVSALPRPLRAAIAAILRFVERPVPLVHVRPPNPNDPGFSIRLDEPLWTIRANGDTWWLRTKGAGMYAQNALSEQPIPVLVANRFGNDPTSDTAAFTIVDTTDPVPDPSQILFPIQSWFTDDQGNHYANCLCGPTGNYVPVPGTTKHLYLKLSDTTMLVLGPVTVTFR